MNLSEHFTLKEFECHDGSVTPKEILPHLIELVANLEVLREDIGVAITINSGYRSPSYNKKIGGALNSQHPKGNAGDIRAKGFTPKQLADRIEKLIASGKMKQGGIGIYKTFTHYDIRGTKARWNG
ncbi:YcbK family protein [Flavobacterium kingsejongi]|uniref:Peptidase M15A C-terminal domain-containing protein n=1 Tax=Flavobacterium kingsejongi TaxID=1678728 RepID=A0A2S1LQR5_9FLAO|nr:D-Ala-D-Ala carboxypeptidase family metallohydrolase [Flavobacterium kingsejongi]AWG25986.1 hypothetical protein FK004_12520 [Flavobacterium kingsejongi]AWG27195.1 hypothetical protein FK004_19220 [Flavobacterium kingsejongi]